MTAQHRLRQYQQQAVATASPERLIAKLYDLGVVACHRGDRARVRAVLVELMTALDLERGGELAGRLRALYEYCLQQSALGDLAGVAEILDGLRQAWAEATLVRPAA